MAVDSRQKRFSFLSFGDGSHLSATFEADGSVDADDRAHLLDLYSGLALASPVIGGLVCASITVSAAVGAAVSSGVAVGGVARSSGAVSSVVSLREC